MADQAYAEVQPNKKLVFGSLFTCIIGAILTLVGFGNFGTNAGIATLMVLGGIALFFGFFLARRTAEGWIDVKHLPAGRKTFVYLYASVGIVAGFLIWYAWSVAKAAIRQSTR
jgi:hypothetical protein